MSSLYEKLGIQDLDAMVSDTLQEIVDSGVGITNTSVGSVVRTIVEAILDNIDVTNYYIGYVYDAMGIDDATGTDLDRLVKILGITRKQATQATGVVTFYTGDEPYAYDISIPFGYEISTRQSTDGSIYTYMVDEENVILKAGQTSIDVGVKAEVTGHQYLPAGSLCVMGSSIVGIASVSNKSEINSGDDPESDDDLRIRSKEIVNAYGKCTDNALKVAVEGVDGINSCMVIDQYGGVGTSAVIVVPSVIPVSTAISDEVKRVVAETKASGINVSIVYPTIKYISVKITTTKSVDDTIILEAISDYANSLTVGQTFYIRQMERKILNAIDDNNEENDDVDITTVSPTANVTCTTEQIIRVNSVTVNGVSHDV